jgi:KUP system potassium uptake protein
VNWILMIACIGLVIGFQTSSNLAAAYGIAVTMTMAITTLLFMAVSHHHWGWSRARALAVGIPFLLIDLAFVGAQLVKIPHGGWFALGVGIAQFTLMTTWRKGRSVVAAAIRRGETPIGEFMDELVDADYQRVPGTAVFLFKDAGATPSALLVNLRHNKVLHEQVLLVSIQTADSSTVPRDRRATVSKVGPGVWQVVLTFGYRDKPNVPEALAALDGELKIDLAEVSYFLGRENVVSTPTPTMNIWRERLFVMQLRTAASAARFFDLPSDRVFEVGTTIEI